MNSGIHLYESSLQWRDRAGISPVFPFQLYHKATIERIQFSIQGYALSSNVYLFQTSCQLNL